MMESCYPCMVMADIPQLLSSIPFSLSLTGYRPEFWGPACNRASEGHGFLYSRRRGSALRLPGNKVSLGIHSSKNPVVCTHWPHRQCCHVRWWEEQSLKRIQNYLWLPLSGNSRLYMQKQETTPSLKHILRRYPETGINKISIPWEWVSM